jgi:hypothetical protein
MHFMRYGYTEYLSQALGPAGGDAGSQELGQYEHWTPYRDENSHHQPQAAPQGPDRTHVQGGIVPRSARKQRAKPRGAEVDTTLSATAQNPDCVHPGRPIPNPISKEARLAGTGDRARTLPAPPGP